MPNDVGDSLLSFDELPLRLRLEGFPSEIAHSIASQWLCAIQPAGEDADAYRVRLRAEPQLRFKPPSAGSAARQIRLRASTVNSTTELRMHWAWVTFAAGHPAAQVEVHPHLLLSPARMELAVGGPLGHALALAGSSFLHGAAVIVDDLPILLLGEAASGKSTVAAAALAAGGQVVSDDSLILYPTASSRFGARTLRRDLFLREGSRAVLPAPLQERLQRVGPAIDSRWVLGRGDAASAFRTAIEPAALCVLRRDRRLKAFRLTALNQAMALTSLLEANASPHLLHPGFEGEQQALLSLWSRLTSTIPAFELRLGPAVLEAPAEVLAEVVARLQAWRADALASREV
ncbi:MAG: hypothetical protein WBP34_10850 [Thermoanaerobaculia bacterium]